MPEGASHSESNAAKAARTRRTLLVALACVLLAVFAVVGGWRFRAESEDALFADAEVQARLAQDAADQANAAIAQAWGVQTGAGELGVVRNILSSPIYARLYPSDSAFVTALYNDVLGRGPGAEELAARVGALHRGLGRSAVANGLLSSNESLTRMVDSFVAAYLNVSPDQAPQNRLIAGLKAKVVSPAAVGQSVKTPILSRDVVSSPSYPQGLMRRKGSRSIATFSARPW